MENRLTFGEVMSESPPSALFLTHSVEAGLRLTLTRPAESLVNLINLVVVIGLLASSESVALLTTCQISSTLSAVDKANKNWLPWQRPFRNRKTTFRLIIYSHSHTCSINPENLAEVRWIWR